MEESIENIMLWLNNIYSHTRRSTISEENFKTNILLVGTHVDNLQSTKRDYILNQLDTRLRGHLDRSPVINQIQRNFQCNRLYFAVSCKERNNSELRNLQEHIQIKSV